MTLPTENVQSYPRPPALEPVVHRIEIVLGGETIVSTTGAFRVLETHHPPTYYIPPQDIRADLRPAEGSSVCEWKGVARYFDVTAGSTTARRAAWCYDKPTQSFAPIAGFVSFYAHAMQLCAVDGIVVEPQPGDFYGGWVTPNLVGRVKGGPGTRHW